MRPKIISDYRLLELATEVILKEGPELFTLRMIAKHAKVSPATLIKRFQTRENLLLKCISQHVSKMNEKIPNDEIKLEDFLSNHSTNYQHDNFVQNISILARDMREPALKKITEKYFKGFRKSLLIIINNDKRFSKISDKENFVLQIEAIYQGAIIQGAFLRKTSIKKNIEARITEYIYLKCGTLLKWS